MMPLRQSFSAALIGPICVVVACVPLARAQTSQTITATANVKTGGGAAATAPVSITVDRFSNDGERDEVLATLKKGGSESVRNLLTARSQIGSVRVGNVSTAPAMST